MSTPEPTTCCRCHGDGIIRHFMHVMGGVCFRCWGTGRDPEDIKDLEAWLRRARTEYRRLRAQGKENSAFCKALVKQGKENAAKVEGLRAAMAANCEMMKQRYSV